MEKEHSFFLAGYCGYIISSGQDSAILSDWVANHSTGFGLPCPLIEHML